jgi:CHAT domain-containing protein
VRAFLPTASAIRRGLGAAWLVAAIAGCVAETPPSPFTRADSLREEGRFAAAHPLYRVLRDSLAGTPDTAQFWRAQLWWAQTLMRVGQADSAAQALAGAFALTQGRGEREAWTRYLQCGLWNRLGRADSAIAECDRSLALAREAGDGELEARVHFQLGTIHSRRGRFRLSVAETERALALERQHGRSRYQLAGTLNSMGIEYAAVGRLGEAAQMYEEGLALARSFGSPWYAFHLLSNLAGLRATTGDPAGALSLMTESFRHAEQLADTQGMVYALNGSAEFYLRAGNRTAAREALERSLAIGRRVSAVHQVIALVDLGLLEAAEGGGDRATRTLEQGRNLADQYDFGLQGIQARIGLLRLALIRGARDEALRLGDEVVRRADSLGSPEALIDALEARAAAREAAGRADAADGYLQGIALLESWRGRLVLGDLSLGVAAPRWSVYEGAIRTLLADGRAAEAFAVAERGRARMLLELMAERDASAPASSGRAALARALRERFQEREAAPTEPERETLDREIASLTDSLDALAAAELARDPQAAARHPVPAEVAGIRDALLRPGRALVAYFWGDSAVYGWWIGSDTIRAARLGSADSLATLVGFLRSMVARPADDTAWRGAARRAHRDLLAPLTAEPVEDLLVVPDGPLAHLPLEVLLPESVTAPLGGTHRITYGPSASVLVALERAGRRESWERGVLAVGNPATSSRPAAGVDTITRDRPLEPLPWAEDEARAVHRLVAGPGGDLLLGRRATPERWLALDPSRYRYLHFAAHAVVDDERPDRTRLVLAGGNLALPDIRRLTLTADLATLSACETALGRGVRGEGVIGLPHAFLSAGARGAVVSLWRVGDRSAGAFMQEFYAELAAGRAPAEALRVVRRRWIGEAPPHGSPAAWAAFVLVGGGGGRE